MTARLKKGQELYNLRAVAAEETQVWRRPLLALLQSGFNTLQLWKESEPTVRRWAADIRDAAC